MWCKKNKGYTEVVCLKFVPMTTLRLHTQPHMFRSNQVLLTSIRNVFLVPGIPLPQVLIPILALLAFTGLIIISLLLSKNWGEWIRFWKLINKVVHPLITVKKTPFMMKQTLYISKSGTPKCLCLMHSRKNSMFVSECHTSVNLIKCSIIWIIFKYVLSHDFWHGASYSQGNIKHGHVFCLSHTP